MATYKVVIGGASGTTRLVEAKTKAQAIAHVVRDTITAYPCEIADAVELGAAGVKVEKAGE